MSNEDVPEVPLRLDEHLSEKRWSRLLPIHEISVGSQDCIIICAGFEDRALAGLELACRASKSFHVILIRYLPRVEENQGLTTIEFCREHRLEFTEFVYDRENPTGMGIFLAEYVSRFNAVFVDISGMSRLLIVQIIVALVREQREFGVIYTEAKVYPPLEQEYEDLNALDGLSTSFISSGIFEVVSTPELSSVSMLGEAIRLISFPTFDYVQLSNLVQEIQPTHNDVIHGVPPSREMSWRTAAIEHLNEPTIRALQRVTIHSVSTLDYRDTLDLLLQLYGNYSVFDRIVIAPTGSKMQSVAIGILRGTLADLQIVYPTPLKFVDPDRYTEGVKQIYGLTIGNLLPS